MTNIDKTFCLGTYNCVKIATAINAAIDNGIFWIDTAEKYHNLECIGNAIEKKNINRKNLCVMSKISYFQQIQFPANVAVQNALRKLNTKYLDVCLIHSPRYPFYSETYKELMQIRAQGEIKEIGVSNFGVEEIKCLYESLHHCPDYR